MKIPKGNCIFVNSSEYSNILNSWKSTALQFGVDFGVYVTIEYSFDGPYLERVYIKALDREFESFNELSRFVKNKAFL